MINYAQIDCMSQRKVLKPSGKACNNIDDAEMSLLLSFGRPETMAI